MLFVVKSVNAAAVYGTAVIAGLVFFGGFAIAYPVARKGELQVNHIAHCGNAQGYIIAFNELYCFIHYSSLL